MWSPVYGAEPSAGGSTCRSGVIGRAIAGNPENDGHLSLWQEAVEHEIIPDTHKTAARTMKENSIRRAVREGRAALGTGLKEFASRGVPWIIEASGFDYCMIDHEHGAFDLETIADLAGWFQATDVSAIVRIHKSFTI